MAMTFMVVREKERSGRATNMWVRMIMGILAVALTAHFVFFASKCGQDS